ncbi:hypothetical protein A9Q77_01005 [Marinomonas sp. 42_23_T18]|nr:hypothetical protein A9Q77_01005 [Marinomonas sp. 42_23_T18]
MQPDIEIYLLSCSNEKIIEWLQTSFTIIEEKKLNAGLLSLKVATAETEFEIQLLQKAAGKRFTSVWFDSDKTPWSDDVECAKAAFTALDCEVRCNIASWSETEEQDPDQWWHINQYEEGPFIWR